MEEILDMKNKRNVYFDNAKFVLILLVVIGHFIEPIVNNVTSLKAVFTFIYLFHMPAFVFISGYFAKGEMTIEYLVKILKKFLLPYIFIQLLFIWYTHLIGINVYRFTLALPVYIYWYLFAMAVWNIILMVINSLKVNLKGVILFSVLLGTVAGCFGFVSWKYSLSRIIFFFPFFLLGYYCKGKDVKNVIKNKWLAISIMVIIAICIIIFIKILT